ncbi:MAG TPA: RNA polymerase sigma factor [Polyangiales bacterium]|nr:RNA polymerase sigma factor [Polyangiales bacterium]
MTETTQPDPNPTLSAAVAQALRGFLESYEPLRPVLYRYCRYLSRSPWDAEDLVQDTLARAFASLGALHEPPQDPRAWLFRVASNLWIDQTRRRSVRPGLLAAEAPDVGEVAPGREVREAAGTLLAQLSPQERAAVVLKDAFELELDDIAQIFSTTVAAVKAALHRGRGKLKEPDPEVARTPLPAALDEFCAAFNARDLDRLTALLLDHATVEVVGAATVYGQKSARSTVLFGMLFGSARMASVADGGKGDGIDQRFAQGVLPTPPRIELRWYRGEVVLLSWYAHHDGEFVRAVTRAELSAEGDKLGRIRNYYYTPEVVEEVCNELELPHRSNGTFRARGET